MLTNKLQTESRMRPVPVPSSVQFPVQFLRGLVAIALTLATSLSAHAQGAGAALAKANNIKAD